MERLYLKGGEKLKDFETLNHLATLKHLSISRGYPGGMPVKKAQIKAFQEARPDVEVVLG